MTRFCLFIAGAAFFGGAASGWAASVTSKTYSDDGSNSATITQTGPSDDKPSVRIRRGPGYQSIEQHSEHNSATIIQQGNGAGDD